MKQIPYCQMSLGLEKLMFEGDLSTDELAQERADVIDAYIAATGWTWDEILKCMGEENTMEDVSKFDN